MSESQVKLKSVSYLSGVSRQQLDKICHSVDQLEPSIVSTPEIHKITTAVIIRAIKKCLSLEEINSALRPHRLYLSNVLYKKLERESRTGRGTDQRSKPQATDREAVGGSNETANEETPTKSATEEDLGPSAAAASISPAPEPAMPRHARSTSFPGKTAAHMQKAAIVNQVEQARLNNWQGLLNPAEPRGSK